jgi:hypothetical protein
MKNAVQIRQLLQTLLQNEEAVQEAQESFLLESCEIEAETFEEAGVLTTDQGLVLTLGDGSQFQITILRSR